MQQSHRYHLLQRKLFDNSFQLSLRFRSSSARLATYSRHDGLYILLPFIIYLFIFYLFISVFNDSC